MEENYIALLGIAAILVTALLLSTNRRAINARTVAAAFGLQLLLAILTLKIEAGKVAIESASAAVLSIIGHSKSGIDMVFGTLSSESIGFSFAVRVLPVVVFFSALVSVLYHLRIMPVIVKVVGGGLRRIIGTTDVESLNAAANIFVGVTEAPLVVRPGLRALTPEQLFAVMVSGLASVAGSVLAAYVLMGADMKYLLAASVMAAPGGLLMAKIIMPDKGARASRDSDREVEMVEHREANVIMAAAVGTSDGIRLAINIGGMLIAFISLISLFNALVGGVGGMVGVEDLTLQRIFGWVFSPLMFLLSVPWGDAQAAGALFGEKLILNEFVAFGHLGEYLSNASERTIAIVTFSLCGFANFSGIAVLLGGLGSLVPEKKDLIAKLGVRAVLAASLSNLMSAALAGLLL